jgi:hypothetical protein
MAEKIKRNISRGSSTKKASPPRGFFAPDLNGWLTGNFSFGVRPGRLGYLLEIRLEDIFVQAQHQAVALGAEGRVVIQARNPLVAPPTVHTLVFINRHNSSPPSTHYNAITIPGNKFFSLALIS